MKTVTLSYTKKLLCLAVLAAPILTGCGSSKDASKSNFADAIDKELKKQCIDLGFRNAFVSSSTEFPVSIPLEPALGARAEQAEKRNLEATVPYEALVKAGLLTGNDAQVKQLSWGDAKEVPGKIYSLTDEGKKALRDPKSTSFCAGNYKVDEVVNFTEPGNAMGMTISQVKYTVSAVDVPTWAKTEAVKSAFPRFAKAIEDKSERQAMMILQNDGWSAKTSGL